MHLLTKRRNMAAGEAASFDEIIERLDAAGGHRAAGVLVTSQTALRQATVYTCVRIVSETIGHLPVQLQQRQANGSMAAVYEHPALGVIDEPNAFQNQHDLLSQLQAWSELQGNGYSRKVTDNRGTVRMLLPLEADDVKAKLREDWTLEYRIASEGDAPLAAADVFHLRNFGSKGYVGDSTISNMRNAIGVSISTEEHAARLFQNGAMLGTTFETDAKMDPKQRQEFYDELKKWESVKNSGKSMLLWNGLKVGNASMSSRDAQFLELRNFQKKDIASLFGVPGFLLNEDSTAWGTGLEQIMKAFVRFAILPRTNRLASALRRELLSAAERRRMRFVFDTEAFTLGTFKEVIEAGRQAVDGGILNPNEVRSMIKRNPRDGGDEYRKSPNSLPEGESQQ